MQGDFKSQTHDLSRYKNMEKQLNKVLDRETLKQATKSDYVSRIKYTEHRGKTVYNYLLHNCTQGKTGYNYLLHMSDKVDET